MSTVCAVDYQCRWCDIITANRASVLLLSSCLERLVSVSLWYQCAAWCVCVCGAEQVRSKCDRRQLGDTSLGRRRHSQGLRHTRHHRRRRRRRR